MARLAVFLIACFFVLSSADASPITWQFEGTVENSGVAEIPIGTPVLFDWTFDPALLIDSCAGAGGPPGIYNGQSATMHLDTTVGMRSYQAAAGFLVSNGVSFFGCGLPQPDMELRLHTWSGPNLPSAALFANPASGGFPGLFWSDPSLGGKFPTSPPEQVFLSMGGLFLENSSGQPVGFSGSLQAVPEPATLALLGSGAGVAVWIVRRRRR